MAFVKDFFKEWKQAKKDKENKEIWKIEIKREANNPNSKFNLLKMSISEDLLAVSALLNLPENYQLSGTDTQKYLKLKEMSMPYNRYLANDLNWGEYFKMPEFYYLEEDKSDENNIQLPKNNLDVEDKNNVLESGESCTYLAVWKFTPVMVKDKKYYLKHTLFYLANSILGGGIVTSLILLL